MDFETEIRETFNNKYVKVFVKSEYIKEVKSILEQINSIHKVNITESQSSKNDSLTLTIYPKKMCSAEEVDKEIRNCLKDIDLSNPILEQPEIENINNILELCPNAKKIYNQALEKYNNGGSERNVLDDMRLCLELFLKKILNSHPLKSIFHRDAVTK